MPELSGDGDCYEAGWRFIASRAASQQDMSYWVLCHGTVTGQGPIEGVEYGHCWVEDTYTPTLPIVYDYSNGRRIVMLARDYYSIGKIRDVTKFTIEEAHEKLMRFLHYGPWEEEPANEESGELASPTVKSLA